MVFETNTASGKSAWHLSGPDPVIRAEHAVLVMTDQIVAEHETRHRLGRLLRAAVHQ